MADNNQMKDILAKLDEGVKSLYESDKYAKYLSVMSRFHNYSTRNTILIFLQNPNAHHVCGYASWKNNFKRQVKKGEHGIRILAPIPFEETREFEKLDQETNKPVLDENGNPVMETLMRMGARFKTISVFDISQTEGEPLPELVEPLTGDVERYDLFMDTLRSISPLPISIEDLPPEYDGICFYRERIAIRVGMSQVQTVSAVIHEMAHALLYDKESKNVEAEPKSKNILETTAESTSYVVCQRFGIETGANSFGYLAEWSKSGDTKELQASLDTIRKVANELIDAIERKYKALAKERGIDLSVVNNKVITEKGHDIVDGNNNDEPSKFKLDLIKFADNVYAKYCDMVAEMTTRFAISSGDLPYIDEAAARKFCERNVNRVVGDLMLKAGENCSLYDQYTQNPSFKAKLDDYAFVKAYLEPMDEIREYLPINSVMPEPAMTYKEMCHYGYTDIHMVPIHKQAALDFFDANEAVYLLHTSNNTESMALDREEIERHDGLFGMEKSDWECLRDKMLLREGEDSRESRLLHDKPGMFGIYQVKDDVGNARDYRPVPMEELEALGIMPDRGSYELTYAMPLDIHDRQTNLHRIFKTLQHDNPECPADFKGRSISVGDVIVLQWRGEVSAHYVDSVGFKELSSFTGEERAQPTNELPTPTYFHVDNRPDKKPEPTVAELEADVRAGRSISLMDLARATHAEQGHPAREVHLPTQKGKPDLLAKITANKRRMTQAGGSATQKITYQEEK